MIAFKGTPGDWFAIAPLSVVGPAKVRTGPYRIGAIEFTTEITTVNRHGDETMANAWLLAAAKDLFEACRMVLDDPGLTASANDVIRAALTKATGATP